MRGKLSHLSLIINYQNEIYVNKFSKINFIQLLSRINVFFQLTYSCFRKPLPNLGQTEETFYSYCGARQLFILSSYYSACYILDYSVKEVRAVPLVTKATQAFNPNLLFHGLQYIFPIGL